MLVSFKYQFDTVKNPCGKHFNEGLPILGQLVGVSLQHCLDYIKMWEDQPKVGSIIPLAWVSNHLTVKRER